MKLKAFDHFRTNVKQCITDGGLRQKDIASKAKITEANLTRILRGQSVPGLDTCEAIANALGVSLTTLIEQPSEVLSDVT